MNKLCKIASVIAVIMVVIIASISVQAYTNNDVIDYITASHEINGRTLQLTTANALRLKLYFEDNPVTDDQADAIIAKLNEAKSKLEASGASTATEVKAIAGLETEVVTLIQEAGDIAGLDIQVNTVTEIVTIKDKAGNNIIAPTAYLELFGSNKPDDPKPPVDPDDPKPPVDPDDPNKPDKPDKPVNPDKPNKPVNPDNKPNNSDNNNNNNANNNSNSNTNNANSSSTTTDKVVNQSTAKKLVYTGNDYSFIIKTIIAIVAVAITGVVIKRHAK